MSYFCKINELLNTLLFYFIKIKKYCPFSTNKTLRYIEINDKNSVHRS